jgi:hypothetical protein
VVQARDAQGRFVVSVDGDTTDAVRSLATLARSLTDTTRGVGRFNTGLGKMASRAGIIVAAAFAAKFLAAAGPVIGAGLMTAMAAAGVAAGGALAIGIGTKLIADEKVVKNAGTRLLDTLKAEFDHSADSMIQPVVNSLGIFTDLTKRVAPQLTQVFEASSIAIEPLAAGLAGLIENAIPGIIAITEHSADMLIWMARALPGIGSLFSDVIGWLMKFFRPSWEIEGFFRRIGSAIVGIVALVRGDFTDSLARGFNVSEDSPIIGTLFRVRNAIMGLWDLIVKGDFSGRFAKAFNVQEDSPIVGVVFRIRDALGDLGQFFLAGGSIGFLARFLNGDVVEGSGGGLLARLEPIKTGFIALFTGIMSAVVLLTPMFNDIKESLTSAFIESAPQLQAIFDRIIGIIGGAMELVGAIITVTAFAIATLWEMHGEDIKRIVGGLWSAVLALIDGTLQIIGGVLDVFIGLFTGDWDRFGHGLLEILRGVWNGVVGILEGLYQAFRGYMSIIEDKVGLAWLAIGIIFTNAVGAARSAVSTGFSYIANYVRDKISEAVTYVTGFKDRAVSALSNLGYALYSSGRDLVQGLINGIMSKVNAVRDAASSIASTVGDWFPGSPVKEGPLRSWNNGGAGIRLGEMLAEGLRKAPSVVASAAGTMAAGVATGTTGAAAGAGSGGGPIQVTIDMRGSIIANQKQAEDMVLGALRGLADRGVPLTVQGVRLA